MGDARAGVSLGSWDPVGPARAVLEALIDVVDRLRGTFVEELREALAALLPPLFAARVVHAGGQKFRAADLSGALVGLGVLLDLRHLFLSQN